MSDGKKCQTCGIEMQFEGEKSFRTGGTKGGTKFLLGKWADIGEDMIPLLLYVCPKCGKVEFYRE